MKKNDIVLFSSETTLTNMITSWLLKNMNFFKQLLHEHSDLKIHDIDIWAIVVRGKELINLEKNGIYRNKNSHNPVLIGKREWDESLKKVLIRDLYPVIRIHDPESEYGKKYNTGNSNDFIYEVGKKMTLEKPIVKKFSQASPIAVSFSDI